jgi:hypothetical protein
LFNLATHPSLGKIILKEQKRIIAGLDLMGFDRINKFSDPGDIDVRHSGWFMSKVDTTRNVFFEATLLRHFNNVGKSIETTITTGRIYDASVILRAGEKITEKRLKNLNRIGLSDDMIKRIGTMIDETPDTKVDKDIIFLNHEKWTDRGAVRALKRALMTDAEETIITPTAGDLHSYFRHPLGAVLLKYKTFLSKAHDDIFLATFDRNELDAYMSMVAMTGMGAIIYGLVQNSNDEEISNDPKVITMEALERSGIFSIPIEISNILSKGLGQEYSINSLIGIEQDSSRNRGRAKADVVLGPVVGTINKVLGLPYDLTHDETIASTHRKRKMIPGQNLFYLKSIFDKAEESYNKVNGIHK